MIRKLPKADYYPHNPKGYDTLPSPVAYTKELVLSIQKQAYEDGLRDAWQKVTDSFPKSEEFYELQNGMVLATNLIMDMLTASQKEAP